MLNGTSLGLKPKGPQMVKLEAKITPKWPSKYDSKINNEPSNNGLTGDTTND